LVTEYILKSLNTHYFIRSDK